MTSSASAENLFKNPSFESNYGEKAEYWNFFEGGYTTKIRTVDDIAYDGQYSISIEISAFDPYNACSQFVTLEPGKFYRVSINPNKSLGLMSNDCH